MEKYNFRHLLLLWILCIVGACSVLPYLYNIGFIDPQASVATVVGLTAAQNAVVYALVLWASSVLVSRLGFRPFAVSDPWQRIVIPGVIAGVLSGLFVIVADRYIFHGTPLSQADRPPAWMGVLAAMYGGVNEEVLLRLFLFSLLYFLMTRFASSGLVTLWIANVVVALMFGLGHLPAAFHISSPDALEITRILLLNGLPGLVFGWLYWSRGLYTAMCAHFVADIVIHVIGAAQY